MIAVLFTVAAPWASFVVPNTAVFALIGLVGGLFPDIDQLEFWGPPFIRKYFTHKKTLHYLFGYLILGTLLFMMALEVRQNSFWFLALACGSIGAGVHSFMDPFDGWSDDNPQQGIYEHLTRRWLPSLQLVVFAQCGSGSFRRLQQSGSLQFQRICHSCCSRVGKWLPKPISEYGSCPHFSMFTLELRSASERTQTLSHSKGHEDLTVNQSDTTNDVDCTTLDKKLMMGYQGWFACAHEDGFRANCWWHWSVDNSIPNNFQSHC